MRSEDLAACLEIINWNFPFTYREVYILYLPCFFVHYTSCFLESLLRNLELYIHESGNCTSRIPLAKTSIHFINYIKLPCILPELSKYWHLFIEIIHLRNDKYNLLFGSTSCLLAIMQFYKTRNFSDKKKIWVSRIKNTNKIATNKEKQIAVKLSIVTV